MSCNFLLLALTGWRSRMGSCLSGLLKEVRLQHHQT